MTIVRIVSLRFADMLEAMARIQRAMDGVSLDLFEQDGDKRWLVERGLETISEASRHLPEEIKARQATIPWRKVADIGNILRHAYDRVAPDIVWKLVHDDLPALELVCRSELVLALSREAEA